MQMTSIMPPAYDRVATQRLFNDLAVELTRADAQIEGMVRNGRAVGNGWGTWFSKNSHALMAGRDQYMALNPQDAELASRLGVELIDFTENGGRIASAESRGATLASSWSSALDSTIAIVQEAAGRLYTTVPTPGQPPMPPTGPGASGEVVRDAAEAAKLVRRSLETIRQLPTGDTGTASTKDARIAASKLNMGAQKLIEPHFTNADQFVVSQLRAADASLEDANWQLAKKPSPDGRFNGVDVPGAQRDTDAAARTLEQLVSALSSAA